MIKAECDRCGKQQETERAAVKVAAGLLSRIEIPVPEGWRRVDFPVVDRPETERKELCPGCVNALRLFLEGDGKVPGLLEPETLEAVEAATEADPRPNLTRRAEVLSSGEAMQAIKTGERAGELLACPEKAAQAKDCSGWYTRGKLTEHMQQAHGGGGGRGRCPYCAWHGPTPTVGQHVAADHPGEYEIWRSGGQQGM